ncbi:MAG: outer membrane protein assembly factor BamD [Pedosphaera sp.]|nr:outer membrane protein assembly factor BamD [Pedosphaera sp.]
MVFPCFPTDSVSWLLTSEDKSFDLNLTDSLVQNENQPIPNIDPLKLSRSLSRVSRVSLRLLVALVGMFFFARTCPAPLIYRPGEGWSYEPVGGGGNWQRKRAKDQVSVAQEAFDKGEYRLALKAARRTVKVWPLSDYAGRAQYLVGRCYEARRMDERAFKEYNRALTLYPKLANHSEIQQRQFEIANRFLGGQWFKLWGYIPFFPSMEKTSKLFDQVNRNGPYTDIGPKALMNIGAAREKQKDYANAVKAYQKAADRYFDRPQISADALYAAGIAWNRQAKRAEYDQSIAGNAITYFNDFKALYPDDKRTTETTAIVTSLKVEQARGAFETAQFYDKYRQYKAALTYYNEVLVRSPESKYAAEARERIENLKPRAERQVRQWRANEIQFQAQERKAAMPQAEQKVQGLKK